MAVIRVEMNKALSTPTLGDMCWRCYSHCTWLSSYSYKLMAQLLVRLTPRPLYSTLPSLLRPPCMCQAVHMEHIRHTSDSSAPSYQLSALLTVLHLITVLRYSGCLTPSLAIRDSPGHWHPPGGSVLSSLLGALLLIPFTPRCPAHSWLLDPPLATRRHSGASRRSSCPRCFSVCSRPPAAR